MATYKVIQDIEAEDKLLGPLTLRQFIYAALVAVIGFVAFRLALLNWVAALPFLPPMMFFALLAFPFGKDQPTEVWLLAKIRFFLKPRKRVWNQSGIKELVTITAPKKIEKILAKDYSQSEVKSRLQALANTIDSRGWAVKNVNVNLSAQPAYVTAVDSSDRLVDTSELPQDVSGLDIQASDDILDERNNPTAQNLDKLINASSKAHRQQIVQQMASQTKPAAQSNPPASGAPADYWFTNQNQAAPTKPGYTTAKSAVVAPGADKSSSTSSNKKASAEEQALLEQIHAEQAKPKAAYGHMHTIQPLSQQPIADQKPKQQPKPAPDPVTSELAVNNDLNVETIARQANKRKQPPTDEVVVSLH